MKFTSAAHITFDDTKQETVRTNVNARLDEIITLPAAAIKFITITLDDSVPKLVYHGLGRAPKFVGHGIPRTHDNAGVGVIRELDFIDPSAFPRVEANREKFVVLWQDSYGGQIDLDVVFA